VRQVQPVLGRSCFSREKEKKVLGMTKYLQDINISAWLATSSTAGVHYPARTGIFRFSILLLGQSPLGRIPVALPTGVKRL
jgi:hypothetical protein